MINNHNQIVCDCGHCGHICLNDGKTVYPDYLEIVGGRLLKTYSPDPANHDSLTKPWDLKNRVEFQVKEEVEHEYSPATLAELEGKHFTDRHVMDRYIAERVLTKDK